MIDLILANATLTAVVVFGMIWAAYEAMSALHSRKAHPIHIRRRDRHNR